MKTKKLEEWMRNVLTDQEIKEIEEEANKEYYEGFKLNQWTGEKQRMYKLNPKLQIYPISKKDIATLLKNGKEKCLGCGRITLGKDNISNLPEDSEFLKFLKKNINKSIFKKFTKIEIEFDYVGKRGETKKLSGCWFSQKDARAMWLEEDFGLTLIDGVFSTIPMAWIKEGK